MDDLEAIALLDDPARRVLYEYVVGQGREVSRNEAATAVGLQRTLAAFHLDRLAHAGLLDISYRRLSERSGPGAGRPAKLYRRAETEHSISVPPRDYARAARLFADAIERSGAEPALYTVACEHGVTAGGRLSKHGAGVTDEDLLRHLAERGYGPYTDDGVVRLRNCPFHALAQELPVSTCGMNLALLEGVLRGARLEERYEARLDPRTGECCVILISKTNGD